MINSKQKNLISKYIILSLEDNNVSLTALGWEKQDMACGCYKCGLLKRDKHISLFNSLQQHIY